MSMGFISNFFKKKNESDVSGIEIRSDLPTFKYYADPINTKAFIVSNRTCKVCGKQTGYRYYNAFYSVEDIEDICPWCIADGSAAKKYDGTFQDMVPEDTMVAQEKLDELMKRTPGFDCLQPGYWPCHCHDFCTFIDHVGWEDIVRLGLEKELETDLAKIKEEYGFEKEDMGNLRTSPNSMSGYLFQCRSCGKYRLTVDID